MRAKLVRLGAVALGACVLVVSPLALAQGRAPGAADQGGSNDDKTARKPDAKSEAPVLAFTQSAFGVHESGVGAQATGGGFGTSAGVVEPLYGGQVYGSPTDKLLLLGSAERTLKGEFAPSASVAYRILGSHQDGYALSALGRFKTEGFDEVGGEVETGALFAWTGSKLHLDANAIVGFGLEEEGKKAEGEGGAEGEVDGELKLRFGYDVAAWIRVGLDGQVRARLNGEALAAGGRTWDAAGGPQVLLGSGQYYLAMTGGPSTMGVEGSGVGYFGMAAAGGILP